MNKIAIRLGDLCGLIAEIIYWFGGSFENMQHRCYEYRYRNDQLEAVIWYDGKVKEIHASKKT